MKLDVSGVFFSLKAVKKAEKTIFFDNLTEELKSAKAVVLVNFAGLSVKMQQELKRRLKAVNARMEVVKNTLLKRAGEAAKVDKEILTDTVLTGQTALIIADDDQIAPLSVLGKFAKEFNVPQLKVGTIEGSFQNTESLARLSTLPGRDVLLGQLLGVLTGPMYGLTGTLGANMQKLIHILQNVRKPENSENSEGQKV